MTDSQIEDLQVRLGEAEDLVRRQWDLLTAEREKADKLRAQLRAMSQAVTHG